MTTEVAPRIHRSIWYMGVKTRVIPGYLSRVLEAELAPGSTVVDLMSGSGVVSAFCADRYRVFANDVQLYSSLITRSLIEHAPSTKRKFLSSLDADADLQEAYRANLRSLRRHYRGALEVEDDLLGEFRAAGERIPTGRAGATWSRAYRAFVDNPAGFYPGGVEPRGQSLYGSAARLVTERAIRERRSRPRKRPSCLVTTYYGNVYFGLRQSLVIDSLRAAIDAMDEEQPFAARKRVHYLSALLHAASVSTSGTSHFAQPRHLRKDSELQAVARRRSIDVLKTFAGYSGEIMETVARTSHRRGNRVFHGDYEQLISSDGRFRFPADVDLVYLDPPYTSDHYSRFYHVLEVIGRYDYPELEKNDRGEVLRGRYPAMSQRFQSGFCRPGRVEGEFRKVARASAAVGAKLVISYAHPTGLLIKRYARDPDVRCPVSRFRELCGEFYRKVRIERRAMMHSGQGDTNLRIEELLLVCTGPRRRG
ncbi:MAG: DNA adenine methylase [Planctomycetota bacterium]|nr:DNA adenine methylase [Planctomycetota bacterium]